MFGSQTPRLTLLVVVMADFLSLILFLTIRCQTGEYLTLGADGKVRVTKDSKDSDASFTIQSKADYDKAQREKLYVLYTYMSCRLTNYILRGEFFKE